MTSPVKSTVEDPRLVERRRAQLIKAGIARFSDQGYHTTTIKDIALAAGVSPGLVYQYVPNKQDLLFLCLLHIAERNHYEIPAALQGIDDKVLRLKRSIEAYARVIDTDRKAVLLIYRETKSLKPEWVEHLKQTERDTSSLIRQCITECEDAGYLAPTHIDLLLHRIIFTATGWALKHWRLRSIVTFEEYVEGAVHVCWLPLLTASGKRRLKQAQRTEK